MVRQIASARIILALLCCPYLAAPAVGAEQRVRVGIYENSPKVTLTESGRPAGIFVDVIEAVAAKEGWRLDYVPGTWSEGLARLAAGKIDLMPDVALTTEREQLYAFHREPVLSSWNQVYARRGSGIRSLLDLDGKRVAVLEGSTQQELFMHMVAGFSLNVTLLPQPDFAAAFRAVADGRADAVVTNRFYGVRHAAQAGLEDTAIIFSPSRLHFAAPKRGDPALLDAIDRHLTDFKKDQASPYYASLRRWTGDEPHPAAPTWLGWAAAAALVVLLSIVAWVVLLRRQVAAKTREIVRRNEEMQLINSILRSTNTQLDMPTLLDEATRGALALSGFDGGVLCLRDPEQGRLRVGARLEACTETDRATDGGPLRDEACPAMLTCVTPGQHHALIAAGTPGAPAPCGNVADPGVRWNAYFLLEARGETVGVLCIFSRRAKKPDARVLALVEDICGPIALAMENARLYGLARQNAAELEARVERRTREIADLSTFLQAIIDHTPNAVFYKGADLRFRGCNNVYEKAFGVKRANFIGKTVLELEYLSPADREAYQAEDAAMVAAGSTVQREAMMPFADGREHQTLYSVSGFRGQDGAPGGLVGVIVDITPLKQAEAALRMVNDEQNAIFEAANFGIALIQDRVIRRGNRRLDELFGYAHGELAGQPTRIWYDTGEADQQGCDPTHLLTARGETHKREQLLRRKDGRLFWCRMAARALDPGDFAKGIVCVVEDVSEERAAAQALVEAKHAAEAADRIKSAFLATMSHELRTPLNSIIGFTGIILQELAGPLNPEQHKQLGMVRNSARHLLALINDVLDISKIEAGELTVAAEPFDLATSIAKVAAIVGPLAEQKGLALSVTVADGVGAMIGDERRVEQILLNLLSNAIKFTESGSVALAAAPVTDFRSETSAAPLPAVRFSVSDTGIGIKPEDMALLFTPFRQVDSEISRNHDGTGLGLAICRRLASLMGGIISAESRWREGSVFTATLPLHPPAKRGLS